jgi:hypothetical protein
MNWFFLTDSIKGKATIAHDAILFPYEPITKFKLIHMGLVMCANLKRTMVNDLTIQFGNNHHIQGILFLFTTVCFSLNLTIFRVGDLDFSAIDNANTMGKAKVLKFTLTEVIHLLI